MRKPPLQDVIVRGNDMPRRPPAMPVPQERGVPYQHRESQRYEDVHGGEIGNIRENHEHEMSAHQRPQEESFERGRMHPPLMRGGDLSRGSSGASRKWLAIAMGVGAIVVLSSVTLSLLFAGATVTVYPLQDSVTVDADLTLGTSRSEEGKLWVEKTVIEKVNVKEVAALGEEQVEEYASGKITIYNELSDTPQRIIKKTRFETPEGLIFRVDSSVEIPGRKSDGTPGSVEVTVRAEEPGEDYNVGPTNFTIPGYDEAGLTEHFEKIYAKSTESMQGGFEGIRRGVNEEDRKSALSELEAQLREELSVRLIEGSDVPEGYIVFDDAAFYEFEEQSEVPVGSDQVSISLKGKLHALLFPVDAFEETLAYRTMSSYTGKPLYIDNIDELSVTVLPVEEEGDSMPWDADTYNLKVQGKAHFIWEYDEKVLAEYFVGKDKEILSTPNVILDANPGIDSLEVTVRPFWKGSFPESAEDITVITELDENTGF